MFLIYTEKLSPRFLYITQHIFKHMLGVSFEVTTHLEQFIKSDNFKISYGKSPIGNEFFVKDYGLLYKKGICPEEIIMQKQEDVPYFFASKKGSIFFDIFSACFYLLSRYEEYTFMGKPQRNFTATDSLAYREGFLEIPLVDVWVNIFKELLQEKYPTAEFAHRQYSQLSVVEITRAWRYQHKGLIRNVTLFLRHLFSMQWKHIKSQMKVLAFLEKDPFDHYQTFIALHKKHQAKSMFFFLLARYSLHDRGISIYNEKYRSLIKHIADYSIVSVLASHDSVLSSSEMNHQRERMAQIINRSVKRFFTNTNLALFPELYKRIADNQYKEDYTMGYPNYGGFRASTCTPFYFYDLSLEVQLPIQIHSYCFHYQQVQFESEAFYLQKINQLKARIAPLQGQFISIMSNTFFRHNTQARLDFYEQIIAQKENH